MDKNIVSAITTIAAAATFARGTLRMPSSAHYDCSIKIKDDGVEYLDVGFVVQYLPLRPEQLVANIYFIERRETAPGQFEDIKLQSEIQIKLDRADDYARQVIALIYDRVAAYVYEDFIVGKEFKKLKQHAHDTF